MILGITRESESSLQSGGGELAIYLNPRSFLVTRFHGLNFKGLKFREFNFRGCCLPTELVPSDNFLRLQELLEGRGEYHATFPNTS